MASFTLDGTTHEYLLPDPGHLESTKSWEYGKYPKVMATVALAGGGTIDGGGAATVPCSSIDSS